MTKIGKNTKLQGWKNKHIFGIINNLRLPPAQVCGVKSNSAEVLQQSWKFQVFMGSLTYKLEVKSMRMIYSQTSYNEPHWYVCNNNMQQVKNQILITNILNCASGSFYLVGFFGRVHFLMSSSASSPKQSPGFKQTNKQNKILYPFPAT